MEAEGRAQASWGLALGRRVSTEPPSSPFKGQLLKRQQKAPDMLNCVLAGALS